MFPAGRMVLRLFLGSHGTLVAVSAPLMISSRLGHSNVPFTFCNKQPLARRHSVSVLYLLSALAERS